MNKLKAELEGRDAPFPNPQKRSYIIFVYISMDSEEPDYTFKANGKRELVGIMKTISDNFDFVHLDILDDHKFNGDKDGN